MSRWKQAYGLACGHCCAPMRIRTSEGMSNTTRTLFLQCSNELCGATYRGYVEVTHQYSDSAMRNPLFKLPVPDSVMRQRDLQALAKFNRGNHPDLFDEEDEDDA